MYNDHMPAGYYEIRICGACGLRYPLVEAHSFGIRCPACLGETSLALRRKLSVEPTHTQPEEFCREDARISGRERRKEEGWGLAVLLDNIRSGWNVGSIFRSADGFGFAHAYLCGITPTPDNESVRKTSLGAEHSVTWSYHKDAVRLAQGLKREGWKIFALEEDERAIAITDASTARLNSVSKITRPAQPSRQREVLIVGNEVTGVDAELLDLCNSIFCIAMLGHKRSFNVSSAFAVAAYALRYG
ncbi:MAG TPA: TrmH family RNA methyltransferase [Anaerolineales bacterium]